MINLGDLGEFSDEGKMEIFISIFQHSPFPKSIIKLSSKKIIYVNSAWEKLTSYSIKEATGKSYNNLKLLSSDDCDLFWKQITDKKPFQNFEMTLLLKRGIKKNVFMFFHTIIINDEEYVINTIIDNDFVAYEEYKLKSFVLSTKELNTTQDFIFNLIENMSDGFVSLDADWIFTYINKKAAKIIDCNAKDLLGKHIWTEFPEAVGGTFYNNYHKAFETQKPISFEDYYKPWGKWFENRVIPSKKGVSVFFQDITFKKKAEDKIMSKEQELNVIYSSLNQPVFMLKVEPDFKFKFQTVNKSFLTILGINEEDVINKYVTDFIPEPSLSLVLKNYKKAIKTKNTVQWEETTPYKTGEKTAIITINPIFNKEGECINLIGLVYDITENKKYQALLIKNKNYLNNIINNIGDPIFVKDEESKLLTVNDAFCTIFNLSKSEIIGKTLAEDVAPDERESFLKIDKQVIETGIENINEETLTVREGETKIILTKKTRFIDENGNKYLIGIIRDITEQKKNENYIKTSKEYSESLISSMHEGLVVFNLKTEILSVNPSFVKMSGFSKEELLGKQCPYPFSPDEIAEEAVKRHDKISKGEPLERFETIYQKKDSTYFNVDVNISSVFDSEGKRVAYFGTVQDTTDRKKAEVELKLAKDFTDKLVMSMQEGLIIVDLDGKIILVNESTCNILGYNRDELIGMQLPYPFAKIEDFQRINQTNKKVAKGESPTFQFEFIRKNGEHFLASFLTGNITNDKGEVIALFGTMKDISDEEKAKKVLEDIAIRSNQKKEVILKLASLVDKNFKSALKEITKLASQTLNVNRVSIWSFNLDKSAILCEKLYNLEDDTYENGDVITLKDNPKYFQALETNQTIIINDAQSNQITKDFAKDYLLPNNIKSLMDVFIYGTKGHYGIICFEHVGDNVRQWTAEEQEFASSIASIVSLMVESAERKLAESKMSIINNELILANEELNLLRQKLELENNYLRNELDLVFNFEEMVYGSVEFSSILTEVEKVAPTNATVLLLGESGTGKELIARAIHNISTRNNKALIKVNCSAIPRELIESELFGHKKGSFTGAINDKVGKFELADGGTLFLDEIGELPLDMQPKILRFLQEGEIEVIGGTKLKKLDVRVIAATNRNLIEEVEKKQFRSDLYFRLNVFPIVIPPLRDRKEDISLLAEHFLDKYNKTHNKSIKYIPEDTMNQLISYNWPGNIRELENLIERALILSNGDTLIIPGFESKIQKTKLANDQNLSLDNIQKNHIISILEKCNWKISGINGAAMILNLKPSTLRDKMTKLGIKKPLNN